MTRIAAYKALGLRCDMEAAGSAEYAQRWQKIAAHHAAMRLKYEEAARYPWLPVAPGPAPAT